MASARAMIERRRSSRVPLRIPIKVYCQEDNSDLVHFSAEVVAVSRYGARLRLPFLPLLGSRIEILHGDSHEIREFRVISANDAGEEGVFELGVEILHPTRNFWGVQFPDEARGA
jgi:PilZ domain